MPHIDESSTVDRRKVLEMRPDHQQWQSLYGFLFDSLTGQGGYKPFLGGYTSTKSKVDGTVAEGDPGLTPTVLEQFYTYLRPHLREKASKFRNRWETAAYANYMEWVLRIWVGLLTREPPRRTDFPDRVLEWHSEIDWWLQVKRSIAPWGLGYGRHWTVITKDLDDVIRPKMIAPNCVLDWVEDSAGKLVEFKYVVEHDPTETTIDRREPVDQVWVLNREGWFFFEIPRERSGKQKKTAAQLKIAGAGDWEGAVRGVCPVVPYMRGERGDSAMYYLAQINRRLFNVMSLKTEIEDLATFPMMYVPAWSEDGEAFRKLLQGTGVGLPIPKDATMIPGYLQYDVGPHDTLASEQLRLISMMKSLATLTVGGQQQQGGSALTGIAAAYEFLLTGATVADFAKDFEVHGLGVGDLVDRWQGGSGLVDSANEEWPKRYDLTEKKESVAAADLVLSMDPGELASKELKKKAVTDVLAGSVTEAKMEEIFQEIDSMEEPEGADVIDPSDPEPGDADPFAGLPQPQVVTGV